MIVKLGFSCALSDQLRRAARRGGGKPSYEREAALEVQETTPEKQDNSLSNPGQMGGKVQVPWDSQKYMEKRSLEKDTLLAVRKAAI